MQIVGSMSPVFAQTEKGTEDKITIEAEDSDLEFFVPQEPTKRHR